MKALLLTICLFAATDLNRPQDRAKLQAEKITADISGWWKLEGKGGGGEKYAGMMFIRLNKSGSYRVHWHLEDSPKAVIGVGTRDGKRLSVGFVVPTPQGVLVGVAVYTIGDGRMEGRFRTENGTGREVLTQAR